MSHKLLYNNYARQYIQPYVYMCMTHTYVCIGASIFAYMHVYMCRCMCVHICMTGLSFNLLIEKS